MTHTQGRCATESPSSWATQAVPLTDVNANARNRVRVRLALGMKPRPGPESSWLPPLFVSRNGLVRDARPLCIQLAFALWSKHRSDTVIWFANFTTDFQQLRLADRSICAVYRRERERESSRTNAMVTRCREVAQGNRWSPFMTAARVRVPNSRNVRSLALHWHGQSRVVEPFTASSLNPLQDAEPNRRHRSATRTRKRTRTQRGRDAATGHPTYEAVRYLMHLSHRSACAA